MLKQLKLNIIFMLYLSIICKYYEFINLVKSYSVF